MSLARLQGIDPGRIGVFAGPLNGQPAAAQRAFVREMERLGYGTLWYGEAPGPGGLRPGRDLPGRDRAAGDRQRHRQHLGPRRGGDGERRPDPLRGLARPLHPGHRRLPRPARQAPRPRLRATVLGHARLSRRDGRGAVARTRGGAATHRPGRARAADGGPRRRAHGRRLPVLLDRGPRPRGPGHPGAGAVPGGGPARGAGRRPRHGPRDRRSPPGRVPGVGELPARTCSGSAGRRPISRRPARTRCSRRSSPGATSIASPTLVRERFEAGADQVVLNLVAADPSALPLDELRALAPLA